MINKANVLYNGHRLDMDKIYDIQNSLVYLKSIKDDYDKPKMSKALSNLQKSLNNFFRDSNCKDVLYTDNTDKLFFGMAVIPIIKNADVETILFTSKKMRLDSYYIEIDSRLLGPTLNLSSEELTAIVLHEIGHLTNNGRPVEEVRNAVNTYLEKENEFLVLANVPQYKQLLAFGIKDSLKKFTSIFDFSGNDYEILADEFVVKCGYGEFLASALKKMNRHSTSLNKNVKNKLLVMKWCLRLYKDVRLNRISAINALRKGKTVSGSKLLKRDIDSTIRNIQQIDDDRLIVESLSNLVKNLGSSVSNIYKDIKIKGIRTLDNDFFDLSMRVKNVDEEPEALSILRAINLRLSILDDYLRSEKLDNSTRQKVFDMIDKYNNLREALSKKSTYKDKYYGLFVQTPTITSRFDL